MGYKVVSSILSSVLALAMATREWMISLKETGESGLDQDEMREARDPVEAAIGLDQTYKVELSMVEAR